MGRSDNTISVWKPFRFQKPHQRINVWDYKDNLDGLLEDKPYNHEKVVITAELPGVELEAVHTSVVIS